MVDETMEEAWSPQRGLVAIAPLYSGLTYSKRSNSLSGGQDETNIEKELLLLNFNTRKLTKDEGDQYL